jgi:hypothetical protein
MRGTPVSASSASQLAASAIAYCDALNSNLGAALRWTRSAAALAQTRETTAQAGPAITSPARANVADVVTSATAPRLTALSEISSPAKAHSASSMTCGVISRERFAPSWAKTAAQHAAPRTMTPVT